MKIAAVTILYMGAIASPANSQYLKNIGSPEGEISNFLTVRATDPVLHPCVKNKNACFRVYVRVWGRSGDAVKIAYIYSNDEGGDGAMYGTNAFTGNGVLCSGWITGSFPKSYSHDRDLWFRGIAYPVTKEKSAVLMVTFGCDDILVPGDELTMQLALAADPDGQGPRVARYVLSDLHVTGRR